MSTATRARVVFAIIAVILLALPRTATAQIPPPQAAAAPPLRIFLDCYQCDVDHLRRNVRFVDYVRDRSVADLHVLVTTQGTGGGGTSWVVKFIGLDRFLGLDKTFTFNTDQTATSDEQRREFARIFRLGLVAYASDTSSASQLDVTFKPAVTPQGQAAEQARDPWHRWVFRLSTNTSLSGEATSEYKSYRFNGSASRVTDAWKVNISASQNYNQNVFKLGDGEKFTSLSESGNASALVVKSLTGKWSWGSRASFSTSSFSNTERALAASSGIEFDFFPYSESNRRSLTLQYMLGVTDYTYREITVFDKLEETIPNHTLNASLGLRQPWGSMGASAYFIQHLNQLDQLRLSFYGNADVRLFKGFSFYVYASYAKIKDQIALRKGEASEEEILLRLTQQSTNYSYNYSVGFSYSFGSIFTSIVNPRFNGPGFFFF
jgi:hypothetical protein